MPSEILEAVEQLVYGRNKRGDAFGGGVPEDLVADVLITVGEDISHPYDTMPRDLGMGIVKGAAESVRGFAYEFDGAFQGGAHEVVRSELFNGAAVGDGMGSFRKITHLDERDAWIMLAHRSESIDHAPAP